MRAPFPWFGAKSAVIDIVWERFGRPKQYIEPFCGSAAMLLGAATPASLEVVNDVNGFIANFWRAVRHQPGAVAHWADYPVSHIDLGARHRWLMEQRDALGAGLQDPNWPGDAQCAGWWLWGQCCWIGSGWCDWLGKIPHSGNAGRGVQALGQIPHSGNAGRGINAIGRVAASASVEGMLTSSGRTAWAWLHRLAARLERVRVLHGDWSRCLNHHYGGEATAVFLDPPYLSFGAVYGQTGTLVAEECAAWCAEHGDIRVCLAGHIGDYDLPSWEVVQWERPGNTYSGNGTKALEALYFSPACLQPSAQLGLWGTP